MISNGNTFLKLGASKKTAYACGYLSVLSTGHVLPVQRCSKEMS